VSGPAATVARVEPAAAPEPVEPVAPVDLSTTCWQCGALMREEHAHYRCPRCGWRDSCCDGPY